MQLEDLIAALASPPGPGATGIIRLSGQSMRTVLEACFQPAEQSNWTHSTAPRRLVGTWRMTDASIDVPCAIMYWPTSRSYTGQPAVELNLPGSPPLLERVLEDLYRRGVRPARPGEFTLRAFLAGKIDLVQAEAVLGVIDADDDAELRTALDQLAGGISVRLMELRADLIELLADLEAGLDFVEEDIEFVTRGELHARIAGARAFVESLMQQSAARMTSSTLPKVVLAGLPNAGKSTLFNRLAGKPMALVSAEQGTTRDYLRAEITCDGVTFELIDTAGWDELHEGLSAAVQTQRTDQLHRAALIVWCTECCQTDGQRKLDGLAFNAASQQSIQILRVRTKCDVECLESGERNQGTHAPRSEELWLSATANVGIEQLRERIVARLKSPASRSSAWLGMTAARCQDSLEQASSALRRAESTAAQHAVGDELLAVDLREALDHLGAVVGAVYTDDLLDRIFSKFCIGK